MNKRTLQALLLVVLVGGLATILLPKFLERTELRTTRYANGNVWSETRFRDGVAHGIWRTYFEDGTPASEGGYADGRRAGLWRVWFADGKPQSSGIYIMENPYDT